MKTAEDLELEEDMRRAQLLARTQTTYQRQQAKLKFAAEATRSEFGRARRRRVQP